MHFDTSVDHNFVTTEPLAPYHLKSSSIQLIKEPFQEDREINVSMRHA